MKDYLIPIKEQLSNKFAAIDLLIAEDPDFVSLCEDHDDCVNALRYWLTSKEHEAAARVSEYRGLLKQLRKEILQFLKDRNLK
jgi:uncharacterized protein YdcH (DUF465 family)